MRSRLINECKPRYLSSQGFQNWRQVNMDLKKLEAHFKGKIPSADVSLLEALTESAGTKRRSQVTGHCFTYKESILNIHKS